MTSVTVRRRREEGQALVEFALVLPVLLLVLLAIIKFGLLFNNYLTLTDAVRSGARVLAVGRGSGVDACAKAAAQVKTSAGSLTTANINVSSQLTAPDTCTDLTQGNAETVTATYPCDLTVFGIDFLPGCNLSVSATERVE